MFKNCKMPKVDKKVLIFISGMLWSIVGISLINISTNWFKLLSFNELLFSIIGGVIGGFLFSYFIFFKIVKKNILRIKKYKGKVCIWAFQKWQSYILVAFMISLGIFMRTSSFVPKNILTFIYIVIGLALLTASFRYYIFLLPPKKKQ